MTRLLPGAAHTGDHRTDHASLDAGCSRSVQAMAASQTQHDTHSLAARTATGTSLAGGGATERNNHKLPSLRVVISSASSWVVRPSNVVPANSRSRSPTADEGVLCTVSFPITM